MRFTVPQPCYIPCETANLPAKVIKEFRKTNAKPTLKAAYIDRGVFIGDDQLDALAALKSKNELHRRNRWLVVIPLKCYFCP